MALVLQKIYKFYNYHFNENDDERLKDLFMMDSPWPIICIVGGYIYFVTGFGQRLMKDRRAFELTTIINIYNIIQVFLNLFMGIGAVITVLEMEDLNLACIPAARFLKSDTGMKIIRYSHMYYLIKVIDLLDTIFFILRKKNHQVSFLHIYHHAVMAGASYLYIKIFSGGGQPLSLGIINSFVHVIMYGYYFLTSFKPELKKSIWWKKHITQIQMIQFAVLIVHHLFPLYTECSFPKALSIIVAFQNIFMLFMFADFYVKAYIKKKSVKQN
ncbi:very long chain fatty acid elongase AAEL008004-like [Chironomus tepperi]|uniref:very long chain fatty acid elongase AAEL008004-like n=1 Tax=Chironomus tepperi TaxID=113505 RepID=UPI00391F58C6